ncbi:class I SAM-dependent methyltransferase [Methanosarcina barkeri]|uniref:class I SAM-dependent methyltransferase n=1 Tax=Methanosarcina barkeri TaxID=2208 RepID=UPI000AA23B8D|nr:class I SAM-dependent methyltransferase [Methanosarcina barkeri]
MTLENKQIKELITSKWDESSATYDTQHGHKVKSLEEADAWKTMFKKIIPEGKLDVLDVGCGTGELSILFAEMGHNVTGLDLSEKMMEKGRLKSMSQGLSIKFLKAMPKILLLMKKLRRGNNSSPSVDSPQPENSYKELEQSP